MFEEANYSRNYHVIEHIYKGSEGSEVVNVRGSEGRLYIFRTQKRKEKKGCIKKTIFSYFLNLLNILKQVLEDPKVF